MRMYHQILPIYLLYYPSLQFVYPFVFFGAKRNKMKSCNLGRDMKRSSLALSLSYKNLFKRPAHMHAFISSNQHPLYFPA